MKTTQSWMSRGLINDLCWLFKTFKNGLSPQIRRENLLLNSSQNSDKGGKINSIKKNILWRDNSISSECCRGQRSDGAIMSCSGLLWQTRHRGAMGARHIYHRTIGSHCHITDPSHILHKQPLKVKYNWLARCCAGCNKNVSFKN